MRSVTCWRSSSEPRNVQGRRRTIRASSAARRSGRSSQFSRGSSSGSLRSSRRMTHRRGPYDAGGGLVAAPSLTGPPSAPHGRADGPVQGDGGATLVVLEPGGGVAGLGAGLATLGLDQTHLRRGQRDGPELDGGKAGGLG